MKKIIFSDLDGTLLDHGTYSFEDAENALTMVKKEDIPLVFCTSKTRTEIEYWREKIENNHPFISENGGGIFVPKSSFSFDFSYDRKDTNYFIIDLGVSYNQLVQFINELKKTYDIQSFSDMTAQEIADDTHLDISQAKLAMKREYELPFKLLDKTQENKIRDAARNQGYTITKGGRYYHLAGNTDKGKAVDMVSRLFAQKLNQVYTIGIGDSENDFTMLDTVDSPYLVMKKDGSYASSDYSLAGDIGPRGWQKVIELELKP